MKHIAIIRLALGLTACAQSEQDEVAEQATETPSPQPSQAASLSDADTLRVCKAGAAFRVGRSIKGITSKLTDGQIVRLSYTRDSDGKHFRYDCRLTGDVAQFRMIDEAGPGTGPGIWSGPGSTTTFKVHPDAVEFYETYPDGSSSSDRIAI